MKGWTSRAGERGRWIAQRLSRGRAGLALGVAMLAICVGFDVVLQDESAAIVGTYVVAPLVTAFFAPPAAVALVGALAIGAAAASPEWNMASGDSEQLVRIGVLVFGTGAGVVGAWLRTHTAGRSERLRLLDAVGAVADGSLPLAETLRRVTDVIVPVIGDICMVDAVHEGRARRIAARAYGRADAAEIEERIRAREPNLPPWLVNVERPWRDIPRWLGVRSTIIAPIRARDRNLGTLTLVTAWSGRRYSAEDLRFARILASRIGLALDNAGLFSDLESVERRMDTVMSI